MNRGSSRRLIAAPNTSTAISIASPSARRAGHRRGRGAAHRLGGLTDGGDDVLVARASADVAFDRVADLLVGGIWSAGEEVYCDHDHARRAEPALQAVV